MKNIYKALCFVVLATMLVACPGSDDINTPPPRPYNEVYAEDIAEIEEFLDTHFVTVDADYNTTFELIPDGGVQPNIMSYLNAPSGLVLKKKPITRNGVDYEVYYLILNEGIGENPTRLDSAFVAYKGITPADIDLTFDQRVDPVWFQLEDVVRGWGEIIPEFKTGTYTENPNGTITFNDYGAGVMFIPSGLGYFNQSVGNIPAYSPLIFNFKLYDQRYRDHDKDGILSKYEYREKDPIDGEIKYNLEPIDTDGDGLPDYLDPDDDNDGVLTKVEITKPLSETSGESLYYPYDPILVDDPLTPTVNEIETKGIPSCSGDFTTSTRLRKHLDASCQ